MYYYVYIMFNKSRRSVYTGVTNDLKRRVWEHKNKIYTGYSQKHNTVLLGYYETFDSIEHAIKREKQIKAGNRANKDDLINSKNPMWLDLYESMF